MINLSHKNLARGMLMFKFHWKKTNKKMKTLTIHANSTSAKMMQKLRCATHHISLPGHDGTPLTTSYSLPMLCDFVIDRIGDESVVLIGNSVGGMIAHQIADRVDLLALISIAIPPLNQDRLEGFMHQNEITALTTKSDLAADEFDQIAASLLRQKSQISEVSAVLRSADPRVRPELLASIASGDLRDEYEILSKLDIPMLFIACQRDNIINNNAFESIPFGEVEYVDAGHLLPFEDPQLCNDIIERFLKKHDLLPIN